MIPNEFWILDPLTRCTWVPLSGGGGGGMGGGENFFAYCGRCVWSWTRVLNNFFLYIDPLTRGRGPGTDFCILTIHNDQISHVKHVSDPLHVSFTLFGCFGLLNDFVTH